MVPNEVTVGMLFVYNLGGAVCTRGLAGAPPRPWWGTHIRKVTEHLLSKDSAFTRKSPPTAWPSRREGAFLSLSLFFHQCTTKALAEMVPRLPLGPNSVIWL